MKKLIIWWLSTAALGMFLGWLFNGCNQPQEIKEDPDKAYKDSIQRRIDSCQAVIDSVELEKKKLGL